MRKLRWLVAFTAVVLIAAACGGDDDTDGTTGEGDGDGATGEPAAFTLAGAPRAAEADALNGFLAVYNEATGSDIDYVGTADFEVQLRVRVEGGDPPDIAFTPQPASICEFADTGQLASLEDMGFDIAEMEANHSQFWMDLGVCEDGNHYGIPWFPNFKSVVFYNAPAFEAGGYTIPETYDDLVALSAQMVADGQTPWCFGFESGGATGWPGTDWIEDILLRQSGPDVYTQWYNHEIPFNDPAVVSAFDRFGEILLGEGFVLGGANNVSGINFQDSPLPLFDEPPGCLMLKQGSFVTNFFPADAPEDLILTFPFPTVDGNGGAMGGGDTIIVFDDSPANVQAIRDWITPEWQCVLASPSGGTASEMGGHGIAGIERLPGHKDVDPACYETEASQQFAEVITEALESNTFAFDASDLMPSAVGQGSFWVGMVDFANGTPAQEVADAVEASWPAG
ncbi:MAG: ABC transporter substrate-binding protein [Actinomycetota bacterium]|nr:ABC transporter substrate-binding protein [Actinomycetota bacterium]